MTILKIQGGLGNQMFQYAFIRAFSLRNNKPFSLDISEYKTYFRKYELEIFNIQKNYSQQSDIPFYEKLYINNKYLNYFLLKIKYFLKNLNKHHGVEKKMNFYLDPFYLESSYIEGFFQSEKYFCDYEEQIRNDFVFLTEVSSQNNSLISTIKSGKSVSIHVRRGDYITNPGANQSLGVCSLEYYKKAISYIQANVNDPVFFFFSDDINWVKENLGGDLYSYYIDWNTGNNSYEDMRLMSMCDNNIIANSSFSWWGAWLNPNKSKIVIAPKKWFASNQLNDIDIVPESWIKL